MRLVVSTLALTQIVRYGLRLSDLIGVHKLADTNLGLVVVQVKLDVLIHSPFLIGEGSHGLPDPWNQDGTAGADQCVCDDKCGFNPRPARMYKLANNNEGTLLLISFHSIISNVKTGMDYEGGQKVMRQVNIIFFFHGNLEICKVMIALSCLFGEVSPQVINRFR